MARPTPATTTKNNEDEGGKHLLSADPKTPFSKPHAVIRDTMESSSGFSSRWWKVLLLLICAVAILFATDSIELAMVDEGAGEVRSRSPSVPHEHNNTNTNETSSPSVEQGVNLNDTKEVVVAEEEDKEAEGPKTYAYRRRAQPYPTDMEEELISKWGQWKLDKPRPDLDLSPLYLKYPNRDVPLSEFPAGAWQTDEAYLQEFLQEGIALVNRTMEAILAEYGKGQENMPGKDFNERSAMFRLTMYNTSDKFPASNANGGWTTESSWEGLKRRLLHSIMTEDSFVFAMSGHSSAAGHGNHFLQSYTAQIQWILEAVFARLGVKHQARNFGNGGMSTEHNGLAASSTFGPDLDILMWDSSMTEQKTMGSDLMARQSTLGGFKVPVFWSLRTPVLSALAEGGLHVGQHGSASSGIATKENMEDIEKDVWASKYLSCKGEAASICKNNEYHATCWIDREDVPRSSIPKQLPFPGGRASWHPGHRQHQVKGRVLAMTILQALSEALNEWASMPGYTLPDSIWHVSEMYKKQREGILAIPPEKSGCAQMNAYGLAYACTIPIKAVTAYTPRNAPELSSIRTLMPSRMAGNLRKPYKPTYMPPDVFNPNLHPPLGEVDVLKIVELGSDFKPVLDVNNYSSHYPTVKEDKCIQEPGNGFRLDTIPTEEFCDGTANSWCNKAGCVCLLSGHNDYRGSLEFDGMSGGWIVFRPTISHGYVLAGIQHWKDIPKRDTPRNAQGNTTSSGRRLKTTVPSFCDDFRFEASIDGEIKYSVNSTTFMANLQHMSKVGHIYVLLEDPSYTGEIEVAVRITGTCKRAFGFSTLYYA